MNGVVYNKKQLEQKLKEWQKRLRLQDWIIKININRERDMTQLNRLGEIQFNIQAKTAIINILDPIDYDDWGKQDMENTLIHELLHLHFSQISHHFGKGNEVYEVLEEQAIESISSGIISAYRDKERIN